MTYHGLTGSNPPWTKERRLAASEFADQVAKSRWLRIQCVNHVFALTLTVVTCILSLGLIGPSGPILSEVVRDLFGVRLQQ
jgi:hypothetical protein